MFGRAKPTESPLVCLVCGAHCLMPNCCGQRHPWRPRFTLCTNCGALARFTRDGHLQPLTVNEWAELRYGSQWQTITQTRRFLALRLAQRGQTGRALRLALSAEE